MNCFTCGHINPNKESRCQRVAACHNLRHAACTFYSPFTNVLLDELDTHKQTPPKRENGREDWAHIHTWSLVRLSERQTEVVERILGSLTKKSIHSFSSTNFSTTYSIRIAREGRGTG